jgi:hypothetical protein
MPVYQASFSNAAKLCAEKKMKLVSLDSKEKHDSLAKHLQSIGCKNHPKTFGFIESSIFQANRRLPF